MRDRLQKTLIGVLVIFAALTGGLPTYAGEVAKADLDILGLGLEVDRNPVTTGIDVPSYVQTIFGGKQNDEALPAPGLQVIGDLTGPGIEAPISLIATPGRKFAIPALHDKGEYQLSNIRLVDESGAFLQQSSPSFAIINVTDVFKTQLRVRQLTAAELRERGITVDARNYDVYEYVVVFGVEDSFVEIPYPVIVDKRTHQVVQAPKENPYKLPPLTVARPPRFQPPSIDEFQLGGGGGGGGESDGGGGTANAPRLPAAIILPSGFGVLHQFFAVIVQVSNASPDDAHITLDEITATIGAPGQMRVAGVKPAVTLGQPVPIYDSVTGNTYLVAGAQGSAEWTLEALKAGTHPIEITVEATYQKPGQESFKLRGKAQTAIVVSDPRFQINFSHPDTVRTDENYTAYAFVTNLSAQYQHVVLDLGEIPACASGLAVENICRVTGTSDKAELDLQPGEMIAVPYQLTSKITGHVFAGAGSANDDTLGVSVKLTMGVSESGIPLSPATLVMPHYARYLPSDFIAANMQLLGLGYSLATAPLNQATAKFPRVIKNDVFQRAQEIARAGQRIFATRASADIDNPVEDRDAIAHLSLDLLGNIERVDQLAIAPELFEWDQLRRQEKSGRRAAAAMARQIERVQFNDARTPQQFVEDFVAATSHRTPFLFAYVHGADVAGKTRPYAMSVWGATSGESVDVPAEAATGWVRTLPYAELTQLNAGAQKGELALVGRWSQNVRVVVVPQSSTFTLHLIYPDNASGSQLRSDIQITDATPNSPVAFEINRGSHTIIVRGLNASPDVRTVPQSALRVLGAAQDLHLNEYARLVSVLFNRPLRVQDADKLRDQFALAVNVPKANYSITRRNTPSNPDAPVQIPSAALQEDGRLINITFDKALSTNANYLLAVEQIADLMTAGSFAKADIVPRIDNNAPGGILTGKVLLGDNTPVTGAEVVLDMDGLASQIEVSDDQGRYMYEFVPRDIDKGQFGHYRIQAISNGRATSAEGAVRLVGEVHTLNLVYLGRGTAKGQVRYNDGTVVANASVTVGSVLYKQLRRGTTDENGRYEIGDLPVGPLTFSVVDEDGRPTFAANAIRTAGEVIEQDLVIERRGFPGTGSVIITVRRSDSLAVVPGAQVGVYAQGYGLNDGTAGTDGTIEFNDVPAGLISILAADFSISKESAGIELELKADQRIEQTIIIPISASGQSGLATLEGTIKRDDPSAPGDRTKDVVVAGAILSIGNLPAVTANADGTYTFADLPLSASGKTMVVFDPNTGRKGQFQLPTLTAGANHFSATLSSSNPEGTATLRVRLTSALGVPVNGYRVFEPGYPPTHFVAKGNGIYELADLRVPTRVQVVAVPNGTDATYGDQMISGTGRVDFNGQIGIIDLRLPGQGTVITRLELRQTDDACSVPPCYTQAFGKVALSYMVWDDVEQTTKAKTIVLEADGATQLNTFNAVPAQQSVSVYTDRHPSGYAAASLRLGFEGDLRNLTLRMETIGDVTGRVYAHDRQTPLANVVVELLNGRVSFGKKVTAGDGTFRFPAVQAGLAFRIVAKYVQDGIYRTGYVDGATPATGGPVSNLRIIMREQSRIEGQVVDKNGVAVPLAYYWAREMAWPNTEYGTAAQPLQADINGRFILNNVFTGPFRISARDVTVQEKRGDYQGTLGFEGDTSQLQVKLAIGDAGSGSIIATVVDSLQAFKAMANAEVTLYNGSGAFDLGSTDEQGVISFDNVPAGTYSLGAFSKAAGRAGRTTTFTVTADQQTSQQVVLDFLGKVAGFVTDPESAPTTDAPVRGMPVQLESGGVTTRDSTDSDGNFTILGVPEGTFKVFAYDYDSGRMAFGPSNLFISKVVQERTDLHLELEKTAKLTVKAYLPNDNGGEGTLAPLASILVETTDYFREQQGNALVYPKMITRYGYKITARELGGEERTVVAYGGWAAGQFEKEQHVVFPSSGSVEVLVLDGSNQPVQDARVQINGKIIYTPENGLVTASAIPFGAIGVSATKGNAGASASGTLQSRSIPLHFTLNLGSSAAISGIVEAEDGIGLPSIGTRVVISVTSRLSSTVRLETLTDASGSYTFTGIPIGGTTVSMLFYGPDDTTIGAERTITIPDGTSGTFAVARVKLDATPPRVLSVIPATNATNVSPSSPVVLSFSEPLAASYLTNNWFQLFATDDGSQVNATIVPSLRPDGTYEVKIVPPAPPAGQRFALRSNVLYRVVVKQGVLDTTGNALRAAFGSSFTTVNYSEPAVARVLPAETQPLQSNETLQVKFNKPVDITSIQPGYGGVITIERLATRGGIVVETIPVAVTLDPTDSTNLLVAPTGVAFAESSFYRLTVSGIRDTQEPPNVQKDAKVVDFFSYDTKKPVARIVSPVAAGETLVSQISYTVGVDVVDETTNSASTDVQSVDFFDANNQWLARDSSAPFAYELLAPLTETNTSVTLKVSATDQSNNAGPKSDPFTWTVVPNAAPANIVITNTPAEAYPTQSVQSVVAFTDEGLKVTAALRITATSIDGIPIDQVLGSQVVQRASTTAAWPVATFNYAAPANVQSGTTQIVATVSDLSKSGTASRPLQILNDDLAPEVISYLPKAESRFAFNSTVTVELKVRDAQTGIKSIVRDIPGIDPAGITTTDTYDAATRIRTVRATFKAPPKNADTRVTIRFTTTDNRNNVTVAATDVIWERVDDANVPVAEWVTPLDGAALPSNLTNWQTTLRVRATDETKVTAVRFESGALAAPVTVTQPKSGSTDLFETKAMLVFPQGNAPFVITAIVSDGDPGHDVELPITIEPVTAGAVITQSTSVSSVTINDYANQTVVVRNLNNNTRFFINVPLTVTNLIVLDGATVSTFEETKLDVTVQDRLFVDADSFINVTGRGYLGGKRTPEFGGAGNTSESGRTLGGTTTGGATLADGSHAGIGGWNKGASNATYGSIKNPADFGGSGASNAGGTLPGGNGGGAALLRAGSGIGRFVIAGAVRADGDSASGLATAGAGGTIALQAKSLITGYASRMSANGGDENAAANSDGGGGGGRIAVRVSDRFDASDITRLLQARGGRNADAASIGGGAGTIFLARPNAIDGELIVCAYDDRNAASTQRVRGTPLGAELTFDAITIGPRALPRFDTGYTIPAPDSLKVDATAMVVQPTDVPQVTLLSTTPAAGADVAQNTSIVANASASSVSGIRELRTVLSVQPVDVTSTPNNWPASVTNAQSTITIPATAPANQNATLKIVVTDRAGRTAETTPVAFNVVSNAAAALTQFDVTPSDSIYANGTIAINATATDDVKVTDLSLTSTIGTITATPTTITPATSVTRQFSVAIPKTTAANTPVVLTLSATDGFPGRVATTQQKTITVRNDDIAPEVTVTAPGVNQSFDEGTGAKFDVSVTALDREVAVQSVKATFEGVTYTLAAAGTNVYTYSGIPLPSVDGTDPVAKTLTISVTDYTPNTTTITRTIFIKPLIDPNGPKIAWSCSSPNALYPTGITVPLRITAEGNTPSNGVSRVEFTINGNGPFTATETSAGSKLYNYNFAIPADAAPGAIYTIRAAAISVSGNESTLVGTFAIVGGANVTTYPTNSTIDATDTGFEGRSLVVKSGATLTIVGRHTFADVIVLDGGTIVQKHRDLANGDLITVDRLFVACNASIDVTGFGYARNATYPGAGTPDDGSSGSHIGRGGIWRRSAGGVYGSITAPVESGGGGHATDASLGASAAAGGGVIRLRAASITIDGALRANGTGALYWGSGAGGSIWLSTTALAGAGSIEARGGDQAALSTGGGGAVAIDYATATGSVLSRLSARGGKTGISHEGSAGTVYVKQSNATFGDLTIDNAGGASIAHSLTELPSFGRASVTSVSTDTVTLKNVRWLQPSLAGHSVRAFAPDGTSRGTWRIAAVLNDATSIPVNGSADIQTQDATAYSGYVLHAPALLGGKAFAAVRYANSRWEYDNGSTFTPFTPTANDTLIASFAKDNASITSLTTLSCAASCGSVNGIITGELYAGELLPNAVGGRNGGNNEMNAGLIDDAELFIRPDSRYRAIIISRGADARIRLVSDANPITIAAGDSLRGVYRFDNIKLATARVFTYDLVEATNPIVKDATSTLTVNAAAPLVNAASVSIQSARSGAVLVGAAASITDADAPSFVIARNTNAVNGTTPIAWNKTIEILFGDRGGASVERIFNSLTDPFYGVWRAGALNVISNNGYLSFSASQTNQRILVGLAPADTTGAYTEPGTNGFNLLTTGVYEIWSNGSNVSKNGSYTTRTTFRIEKTPAYVRWYVDGTMVHERTGIIPALRPDLSFQSAAAGQIHSIEFSDSALDSGQYRAAVAADGSFRIPINAQAGDVIAVRAYDSHADSMQSADLALTMPNNIGVQSLTLADPQLTGGRTTTGTVTLRAPAPSDGALIALNSNTAGVTVPSTLAINAGQLTGTFTITTIPVTAQLDVTLTASYAGANGTALLKVFKDTTAPTIAIVAPTANATFNEGTSTITLQADVTDADSGVKRVYAMLNGQTIEMPKTTSKGANAYFAQVVAPFVDGTQPVPMNVVITALDNNDNANAAPAVPVVIIASTDANPPVVTWSCFSSGMLAATGSAVTLKITAVAPNSDNPIQKVEFVVTAPGGIETTFTASSVGNNEYQTLYTVPAATDGAAFAVRAIATTASGTIAAVTRDFTAMASALPINSSLTIAANDTTYDGRNVVVNGGTVTIAGTHSFKRLAVLSGATVVQVSGGTNRLDLHVDDLYIACGGAISGDGLGYPKQQTYSGATPATGSQGGNHFGRGGNVTTSGYTFGSIVRPQEAGGGAYDGAGGGIIRIDVMHNASVDGAVRANGAMHGGGGGAVWITTQRISGSGTIEANGANATLASGYGGGGGAVAIEYTDATSVLPTARALSGAATGCCNFQFQGAAGVVYLKGPQGSYGELRVTDTTNRGSVELPSLGSGTALTGSTGATLITDRGADIPLYFKGHWIELATAAGVAKGTYRIGDVSAKTAVLEANGSDAPQVAVGDRWQGVYRFDTVTLTAVNLISNDPIRTTTQTIGSGVTVAPSVSATNLTVLGTLRPQSSTFTLDVANELRIETGAVIDADGKGYAALATYPGATPATTSLGGSHFGRGGNVTTTGYTFGSIDQPRELGGGSYNNAGGGAVRVRAANVVVNGTLRANGATHGGAGGSIWITTQRISGSGTIEANGANATLASGYGGGGGAVAIEYSDVTSVLPLARALSGTATGCCNFQFHGSPGTLFVKKPSSVYGDLSVIDTAKRGTADLPAMGSGIALAGSGGALLVANRVVPAYFAGHFVELIGVNGDAKGRWRIESIAGTSITLAANGSVLPNVIAGDAWRGVYLFDNLTIRLATVVTADGLTVTNPVDKDASSVLTFNSAAPVFPESKRAQIVVESTLATGDAVTGPAGAVVDTDTPIKLTVTNVRTLTTYTANANSDGSFRIPVAGQGGDAFTMYATDSHALSLSSPTLAVNGALVEFNSLQSLVVTPSTTTGGTTAYGTMRLNAPAKSTGVTVALTSSSAIAAVASTVIVPAGATAFQFPITTTTAATSTNVTITATLGASSKSATFTVTPSLAASLTDVSLSAATTEGGTSINGTVLLGAPAPAGGALVTLTSTAPQASVPANVIVPEGAIQASFTVTTRQVGANTDLQIGATWGASDNANLRLTPCAAMGSVTTPASSTLNTTWLDDAAPSGATVSGDATFDATRVAFGSAALHFAPPVATSIRTYSFSGATALSTTANDRLALWALVNPCNPPRQILINWSDGTNSYRVSWGESRIDTTLAQIYAGSVPAGGVWTRLDVLTRALGITANKNLTGLTISVDGGEVWFDGIGAAACSTTTAPKPNYLSSETVWFDDAFPAGSTPGCTAVNWSSAQVASGTTADLVASSGAAVAHCFTNAQPPLQLSLDDVITTYVYLDPCNPPRQIALQLYHGTWDIVYWGENLIDANTINTVARRSMGPLPETGKWVRLEIPVAGQKLNGAALNGFAFTTVDGNAWFDRAGKATHVNLALGKTAKQSSNYDNDPLNGARNATDGDVTNFTHTWSDPFAYWEVDLGSVQPIESIDVWASAHCCPERSKNSHVFVSDEPFVSTNPTTTLNQAGVTAYYNLLGFDRPTPFAINRTGRYVRVQLLGTNYLHLAEVQVWAPLTDATRVNIGGGKKATQSSTYFSSVNGNYVAQLAVNGVALDQNLSHTQAEAAAHWDLDLGAVEAISTIDVNNVHPSCCLDRMSNFYLFVSDTAFAGSTVASAIAQSGVSAYYRGAALSMRQYPINRTGRYIRLQLTGTDYLHPYEVSVWSPSRTITALAKPAFDFASAKPFAVDASKPPAPQPDAVPLQESNR